MVLVLHLVQFASWSYVNHVALYCARAVEEIKREVPNAQIDWLECDLGNLRLVH